MKLKTFNLVCKNTVSIMAWGIMKKHYDLTTIVVYLKQTLLKRQTTAWNEPGYLVPLTTEWTRDTVAPEAAGTVESNKQMRRIGVECQSSAVSALWFRLCYYIIKFGLGSCFLRDYVSICCLNMCQPVKWGSFHEHRIRFREFIENQN